MANSITTLYIDETKLRLMVTRGRRINKLGDVPLDATLAEMTAEEREAEIVAKIKQLFKAQKVTARKVIIGLSGMHCLSRPIVLPELPRAMLNEAVVREAKRVLPVPLEQLYVSWEMVSSREGKTELFMEAVPRQAVDTMISIAQKAGLKPYMMDIKPLALARMVKEPTAMIIDVQATEFDIVIMVNGIPQPIRTVPFASQELSQQEKLLTVLDELRRTIQFYNTNNPDIQLQLNVPIYVSGEFAESPDICESLSKDTGYGVTLLSSPLKCSKQMDPTHYMVNIGLALKETKKEAGPLLANVNTLPDSYLPKQISMVKLVALPSAGVVAGLLFMLALTIQGASADIASLDSQLDTANHLLEQRQAQKDELKGTIDALEEKLGSVTQETNVLKSVQKELIATGTGFNDNMAVCMSSLVKDLSVVGLNQSGERIAINGIALSEAEVLRYARNLDASGRFTEVTISGISLIGDEEDEEAAEEESADEETSGDEEEAETEEETADETTPPPDNGTRVNFSLSLTIEG